MYYFIPSENVTRYSMLLGLLPFLLFVASSNRPGRYSTKRTRPCRYRQHTTLSYAAPIAKGTCIHMSPPAQLFTALLTTLKNIPSPIHATFARNGKLRQKNEHTQGIATSKRVAVTFATPVFHWLAGYRGHLVPDRW